MLIENVIEEKAGEGTLLDWLKAGPRLFPCPLGTPIACDVDLNATGGSMNVRRGRVMFDYRRGGVVHSYAMSNPSLPLTWRCFRHLVMCSTYKELQADILKVKVLEPECRKGLYQMKRNGYYWSFNHMKAFLFSQFKKIGELQESDRDVPLDELAARLVKSGRFGRASELCVLEETSNLDNDVFADYKFECKVIGAATRGQLSDPGYVPPVGSREEFMKLLKRVDSRRAYALVTVGYRLKVEPGRSCPSCVTKLD